MKKFSLVVMLVCAVALTGCGGQKATDAVVDTIVTVGENAANAGKDAVEASSSITDVVVGAATDVLEQTETETEVEAEHECRNAEPVDWTGTDASQYSATMYDGTRYGITLTERFADYIYVNDEQLVTWDAMKVGHKVDDDLYTLDYTLDESNVDTKVFTEYAQYPSWYYYTLSKSNEWLCYEDGKLICFDMGALVDDTDAYVINGREFRTLNEFASQFGKPYVLRYSHHQYTDADYGNEEVRGYQYCYNFGDYFVFMQVEYPNDNLSNIPITWIRVYMTNTFGSVDSFIEAY